MRKKRQHSVADKRIVALYRELKTTPHGRHLMTKVLMPELIPLALQTIIDMNEEKIREAKEIKEKINDEIKEEK